MTADRPLRISDERGAPLVVQAATLVEDDPAGTLTDDDLTAWADVELTRLEAARVGDAVTAEVVVEGWLFVFTIEDEARAALRERAGQGGGPASHHGDVVVRSVIPGRIVVVDVGHGDVVEAGDRLLVVEAMKMQNEIRAPRAGSVVRITVAAGATVEVGAELVVLG